MYYYRGDLRQLNQRNPEHTPRLRVSTVLFVTGTAQVKLSFIILLKYDMAL